MVLLAESTNCRFVAALPRPVRIDSHVVDRKKYIRGWSSRSINTPNWSWSQQRKDALEITTTHSSSSSRRIAWHPIPGRCSPIPPHLWWENPIKISRVSGILTYFRVKFLRTEKYGWLSHEDRLANDLGDSSVPFITWREEERFIPYGNVTETTSPSNKKRQAKTAGRIILAIPVFLVVVVGPRRGGLDQQQPTPLFSWFTLSLFYTTVTITSAKPLSNISKMGHDNMAFSLFLLKISKKRVKNPPENGHQNPQTDSSGCWLEHNR